MKTTPILLASLLSVAAATAQPPPTPPPRGDGPGLTPPPGPDDPREPRKPLDRWMNGLREWNPDEHQRLLDLRENDPEAFKRELRERRDRLRDRGGPEGAMPELRRLHEILEGIPPDQREQAVERCAKFLQWQRKRPQPGPDHARVKASEQRVDQLARAYREAPEDERETLRTEIRTQLDLIFEFREGERQEQIDEAENHLNRLKEALDVRREHHREIVKRRLYELTGETLPDP